MREILHILTRPNDRLAQEIVAQQQKEAGNQVVILDLTKEEPEYKHLLENIFAAESVQVW